MKLNKNKLPNCYVETTLTLISNKWKVLIIKELFEGIKRFGELKKSLNNISHKVLTYNLREMEEDRLIMRKVYPEIPPKVEYMLTDTGKSLYIILGEMRKWGKEYTEKIIIKKGDEK